MSIRTLTNLTLRDKNLNDSDNIFEDLITLKELIELDLSNNSLTKIPYDLSSLENLTCLDLTNNPFSDFDSIALALSTLPRLIDLKINIADQNEAIAILSNLTNLQFLNGKSTKEEATASLDIEDKEIDLFSLNNEIENFNGIFNRINEKLKQTGGPSTSKIFFEEFHSRLTGEVQKINGAVDNTVPNYIYAANLLKAKISIYSFFHSRAVSIIANKDPETAGILNITGDYIKESNDSMYELLTKLNSKIEEKVDFYKQQADEAIKSSSTSNTNNINNNNIKEFNQLLSKLEDSEKEKEFMYKQYEDEKNMLLDKISKLESENKQMTEKIIKKARDISNDEYTKEFSNVNKSGSVLNRSSVMIGESPNINNNSNNNSNLKLSKNISNSSVLVGPVGYRVLTKKMLLEIIDEIYLSKENFDRKCLESKMPEETMEQHMYTYLNQKYGLKNLIIEWATSIINGIRMFSPEDSEICLFGKILRNELEEESRIVNQKLKSTIGELLSYFLKAKYPLKSNGDIKDITINKQNGLLNDDEWKGIVYYIHEKDDGTIIENKIFEFIKRKYFDVNKFDNGNKKLTREEIQNLSKAREDYRILYVDFVKIILDYQIRLRDKYLRNFCYLFRNVDNDNNGIINEDEFVNLLSVMNIFPDKYFEENAERVLNKVDPFNNKQITFSQCVALFSNEICTENDSQGNKIKFNILDKISLNDDILK